MNKKELIVLVDGSSYLYRAFHALPPLTNSRGQATGAVYGVINMMRRLIADYQPKYFAVVFDAKGKTFRHQMYDKYKANRPPMPDDLREQIEPLHRIIQAMGIPLLVVDGVEADDVIGTLAEQSTKQNLQIIISSGDKDLAQLVNPQVGLINTMNNGFTDEAGVVEKFGVNPDQIIDYLALVGDTSDNIPGVPKVGPKTAIKWLRQYGTLDEIVNHANEIGGKVGENLRASLDQLPLSRALATIKCDVQLDVDPTELIPAPADIDTLEKLYTELEFKTWLRELRDQQQQSTVAPSTENTGVQYETIMDEKVFSTWLEKLGQVPAFAFDTETTSLDYMCARVVGVSFAIDAGVAAYVPLAHDYEGAPQQLDRDGVLARLKPLLENPGQGKIGQNLKYDMNVLCNHGIKLDGIAQDTMLESYVLDSTATRHDMDSLALKYLGHQTVHFEDIAGKGVKQLTFNQIEIEKAAYYAAEDADITLKLHQKLWPLLTAHGDLQNLYQKVELPLIPVLSSMERIGVLIDAGMLAAQSDEITTKLAEIEQQAFAVAGEEFNLGSPKQIQEILFNKLKIPVLQKTPKGQPSTAESVLQELAGDYPLPRLILEHRSLSKLKSTYTDRLPEQINAETGRVHTSYHQAVASTGRLSSSDPNLQNIPIRTAEGRRIRQAFIAPPAYQLIAADYSQIELRILAHLSGDRGLLTAFAEGEDIHRATAAEVFNVAADEVTADQRRSAKAINFGLVYGMSAFGLGKQLGIDRGTAQDYINLYFDRYPGVRTFMDRTRASAHERGYVETLLGRRLYLPEINSRNGQRRQYAERTAINAPMQGSAADIIKKAMIATHHWIQQSRPDVRMIMQVHDELVFEAHESCLEEACESIRQLMSGVIKLDVPLIVDVGTGSNWEEAH